MTTEELAAKARPLTDSIGRGTRTVHQERDEAKERFLALKPNTKAWREAEEDLNFWQGKVAMTPPLVSELVLDQEIRDRMGW